MSDEYDTSTELVDSDDVTFSAFIPLLVLLIGFLIWIGYQDYAENVKRGFFKEQLEQAGPVFDASQKWQGRYTSIMKDLNQVAGGGKDPVALAILKDAVQAGIQQGLIRLNQNQPPAPAADASSGTSGATDTSTPSK